MARKYIDADTFKDFKNNQDKMIEVLNHNMTRLTDTVVSIEVKLAELLGSFKVVRKIVWWILGIVAFVVGAALLASFTGT